MNPPGVLTRFFGRLPVAMITYIACATAVIGWFQHQSSGWLALAAVVIVNLVRKASGDMRRYNQWSRAWQAMSGARQPVKPKRKRLSTRVQVTMAIVSFVIAPVLIAAAPAHSDLQNPLMFLWLASAARCVWALLAWVWRKATAKPEFSNKAKAATNLVKWMLPRASSSPSRADATRMLPDYCLALMRH